MLHVHNTQKLSIRRPTMIIKAPCRNFLDLVRSGLSTYFSRSQKHLPTEKHPTSSRCRDSNHSSFSPWCLSLAEDVHSHYHLYLSCSSCCKMHSVEGFSLPISPRHPYTHMVAHLFESSSEIFHQRPNTF